MIQLAQAMVFDGPKRPLQQREFNLPTLRQGEILVRVNLSTLCGSDLHTFVGHRLTSCPTILGHEIVGTVAALPDDGEVCDILGRALQIGDRITWSIAASCDDCFFCKLGIPQKCEQLFKYGHERITDRHPLSGGLADYCQLAAGTTIVIVPDELSDMVAAPANCATATVAAALRIAGNCRDQVVLIQGAGMLGVTATAMAYTRGARQVIVTDIDVVRLNVARRFGATETIYVKDGDTLGQTVRQMTANRGVDIAVELSGSSEATESAIDLLRIGGRLILVGAVFPGRPVAVNAETVVRKLLTIQGMHNYMPADLATAIEFLTAYHGRFPFAELVSARYSLSDANAAFQYALETHAYRVAIKPSN